MRVIAGHARGRRLQAPRGFSTRPASVRARQSIFSRLAARMGFSGLKVLDLFAGSGSLGIEALSRGASHATFVDSSRAATRAVEKNLRTLGFVSQARVMTVGVRVALMRAGVNAHSYDLVFVDPPYRHDNSDEILRLLADSEVLAPQAWIVVRQSRRAPGPPRAPEGLASIVTATIGDHRIAYYRRLLVDSSEALRLD